MDPLGGGGRGSLAPAAAPDQSNLVTFSSELPRHSHAVDSTADDGDFHPEIVPCIRRKSAVGNLLEMVEFVSVPELAPLPMGTEDEPADLAIMLTGAGARAALSAGQLQGPAAH